MYSGTSYASGNPYVVGGYRVSSTSSTNTTTHANPVALSTSSPLSTTTTSSPVTAYISSSTTMTSTSDCCASTSSLSSPTNAAPPSSSSTPYGGVGLISSTLAGTNTCSSTSSTKNISSRKPIAPLPLSSLSSLSSQPDTKITPAVSSLLSSQLPSASPHSPTTASSPYSTFPIRASGANEVCSSGSSSNSDTTSSCSSPRTQTRSTNNYQRSSSGTLSQAAAAFAATAAAAGSRNGKRSSRTCGGGPSATNSIKVEVVETDMTPGADGPTYSIKLNMNGRSYVAKRHHNKLRSLVDGLRDRGYRVWRPFPEVEEMVGQAPVKVENSLVEALPFYEGFGYSIKSLASTMLKSTSAAHLRKKRSVQLEQMSARIDAFLKTVFLENDDLQYEQVVSQFFWEPLEKKLPVWCGCGSDSRR